MKYRYSLLRTIIKLKIIKTLSKFQFQLPTIIISIRFPPPPVQLRKKADSIHPKSNESHAVFSETCEFILILRSLSYPVVIVRLFTKCASRIKLSSLCARLSKPWTGTPTDLNAPDINGQHTFFAEADSEWT